ncbi:MAG: sigma-70 family RNA polymerase sigma factor [Planctomycetes bacterium]|nr:sigma-70 family RNA polymerase sigma factor [Planctomycetota bacterium]
MTTDQAAVESPGRASPRFATTHWSLVLEAGRRSSPQVRRALESLCEAYWYPLYAYVRRSGRQPAEAQDLTQEFFLRLVEKDYLAAADPDRGRFRNFLLVMFKRFLAHERQREGAQKRGGDRRTISFDFTVGEERFSREPADDWTPERVYQRRWALALLDRVLARLEADYAAKGRGPLFHALKGVLTAAAQTLAYAEAAESLGLSEGAVKVAAHRLRRRYRDLLREEVAHTVQQPEDVDDELNHLLEALRGE